MTQFPPRIEVLVLVWVLLLILLVVSFNCIESPLAPIAPSSDIQLSIPILDKRKFVDEMMSKDTSFIKRDVGGGYYFIDRQNPAPVQINLPALNPPPSSQKTEVGQFKVNGLSTPTDTLTAGSFGIPVGTLLFPIPATDFSAGSIVLSDTTQFDYVAIYSGTLTLTVKNFLPFTILFPQPIVLRNVFDNSLIASFTIDSLQKDSSKSVPADLFGKILRNSLKTDPITIRTTPVNAGTVISATSGLIFSLQSTQLIADSAAAKIPSQDITSIEDSVLVVSDSMVVNIAKFSSGVIQITLVNQLDIDVGIEFSINEFKDLTIGGLPPFKVTRTMSGKQTLPINIDFSKIRIESDSLLTLGTKISFSMGIKTINSGGLKRTVSKKDFVSVSLGTTSPMILQSFTGKITPQYQLINQSSFINFGEAVKTFKPDSLKFDSVQIDLGLKATAGFVTEYDLQLIAKNSETGNSFTIPIQKDRLTGSQNVVSTTIVLNNSSGWAQGFLDRLFAIVPDTLTVMGLITVNPDGVLGGPEASIYDTSTTSTTLDVYFPVKIGIYGGKISDTVKTEFPKDLKSVVKGQVNLEIYNRIPMQMSFKGEFLNRAKPTDPFTKLFSLPLDGTSRKVNPAPINSIGVANDSALSVFSFTLDGVSINKLVKADSVFFFYNLDVQTSQQSNQIVPVRIQANDFIRLRGSGNLVYTINKQ